MAFLLDTNAWIVYLKLAQSPIRSRLEAPCGFVNAMSPMPTSAPPHRYGALQENAGGVSG